MNTLLLLLLLPVLAPVPTIQGYKLLPHSRENTGTSVLSQDEEQTFQETIDIVDPVYNTDSWTITDGTEVDVIEVDSIVFVDGNKHTGENDINQYTVVQLSHSNVLPDAGDIKTPSSDADQNEKGIFPDCEEDFLDGDDFHIFRSEERLLSFDFHSFVLESELKASSFNCSMEMKDVSNSADCLELKRALNESINEYTTDFSSLSYTGYVEVSTEGKFGVILSIFGSLNDVQPDSKTQMPKILTSVIKKPNEEDEIDQVIKKWCSCIRILKTMLMSSVEETCFKLHEISDSYKILLTYFPTCELLPN